MDKMDEKDQILYMIDVYKQQLETYYKINKIYQQDTEFHQFDIMDNNRRIDQLINLIKELTFLIQEDEYIYLSDIPKWRHKSYKDLEDYLLDRNIYYVINDYSAEFPLISLSELSDEWEKIKKIY